MAMKRQFSVASLQQYLERVPFNKSESQYEFVVVVWAGLELFRTISPCENIKRNKTKGFYSKMNFWNDWML